MSTCLKQLNADLAENPLPGLYGLLHWDMHGVRLFTSNVEIL